MSNTIYRHTGIESITLKAERDFSEAFLNQSNYIIVNNPKENKLKLFNSAANS